MQVEAEDSFVSINLETSESCDICGLDTGERVVSSCKLCLRKTSREPVQIGFNHMPNVLHAGVVAHESCLTKSHQALTQARHSYHSPLLHRRGTSVPSNVSSLGLRETVGDKLQWFINYAKNEDIKNKQNRLQVHSNPCTRSSSPVIFRTLQEDALLRRNSENNLRDADFLELRKSYLQYLYGNRITQSHSDDNIGHKTASSPSISIHRDDNPQTGDLSPSYTVPQPGSLKSQIQSPVKDGTVPGKGETYEPADNNNDIHLSEGSKPESQTIPSKDDSQEKADEKSKISLWSNKQKMDTEQLTKMRPAEIRKVVSNLENLIKDISAELVHLLQERDSLGQEVRVRNLTIQKLVQMKHRQQDAPIKTAGVGNI